MSQLPRIAWGTNREIVHDLPKRFNAAEIGRAAKRVSNQADSGVIETLEFFVRDQLRLRMNHLRGRYVEGLQRWHDAVRDGDDFALWLDRDLLEYWGFEGESIVSNNRTSLVVSRDAAKYYESPTSGLVVSGDVDQALFGAGLYGSSIYVDGAYQNLLTDTEDFLSANWTKSGVTVTANSNIADDPKGGATADQLSFASGGAYIRQSTSTTIGTDSATFSVWLRSYDVTTQQTVRLEILRSDTLAILAYKEVTVTGEWQRFEVTYETTGSISANWVVQLRKQTDPAEMLAWGAQLNLDVFASAYRTSGNQGDQIYASIGRPADLQKKGSIVVRFKKPMLPSKMSTGRYIVWIENSATGYGAVGLELTTSGYIVLAIYAVGGGWADSVTSTNAISDTDWHHVIATWDLVDNKRLRVWLDGTKTEAALTGSGTIREPDQLWLGSSYSTSIKDAIYIDELLLRADELSDDEATYLANLERAIGHQRTYWSSLLLSNPEFSPIRYVGADYFDIEIEAMEALS